MWTRLTNAQIDNLKILETHPEFQAFVAGFRKKFAVDTERGSYDIGVLKMNIGELDFQIKEELMQARHKFNLPYPLMRSHIKYYLLYGKWDFSGKSGNWSLGTPANYKIQVINPSVVDTKGRVIKSAEAVSLITYKRLSTEEEKMALKELKDTQDRFFNPYFLKQHRSSKKINLNLEVESAMNSREPKHKKEQITSTYLQLIENKYKSGKLSDKEFKKIKRINPAGIKMIKQGKSSADVAKKVFGSTKYADRVRKIDSRIKKKRGDLF